MKKNLMNRESKYSYPSAYVVISIKFQLDNIRTMRDYLGENLIHFNLKYFKSSGWVRFVLNGVINGVIR